jgi:hypothetical protein
LEKEEGATAAAAELSEAGLAELEKFLGRQHETVLDYKQKLERKIEELRREKENAKTPEDRLAGKLRYKKILQERAQKAERKATTARNEVAKASELLSAAEERCKQVAAQLLQVDIEIKDLALPVPPGNREAEDADMQGLQLDSSSLDEAALFGMLMQKMQARKEAGCEIAEGTMARLQQLAEEENKAMLRRQEAARQAQLALLVAAEQAEQERTAAAASGQTSGLPADGAFGPARSSLLAKPTVSPYGASGGGGLDTVEGGGETAPQAADAGPKDAAGQGEKPVRATCAAVPKENPSETAKME